MNNPDFDGFYEGDWDDRSEANWSEQDWLRYLRRHEREVHRFRHLYSALRTDTDRIDEVARHMGWDQEDWSLSEGPGDAEDTSTDSLPEGEGDDLEPYTLHKHPVYIFTRGLYADLREAFEKLLGESPQAFDAATGWKLARAFDEGEHNAFMALQSQDLGDFALTLLHFKRSLHAMNRALAVVQGLRGGDSLALEIFRGEAMPRLFDLREVWLRVMNDCRFEMQRRRDAD